MVGLVLAVGRIVVVLATRMMAVDLMVKVMVMYGVWYFGCIHGYLVAVIGEVLSEELVIEVLLAERWTAAAVTVVAS